MQLKYNYVPNETERNGIYERYVKQAKKNGESPVAIENVLFLSSSVSSRDEDEDISDYDARLEAGAYLKSMKSKNDNIEILLLQIGFSPEVEVYVGKDWTSSKSKGSSDGMGK